MKRVIIGLFVLLFSLSFVFAADGWGDINTGDNASDVVIEEEIVGNDSGGEKVEEGEEVLPIVYDDINTGDSENYTFNFYVALGIGIIGIGIVVLFIYLFIRKPKNKWRNSKVVKS